MVDEDDRDLFRDAMADVKRIKPKSRASARRDAPRPEPRLTQRNEREVMAELLEESEQNADAVQTGEEVSYLRPGYQSRVLRRLRRGQYAVQGEIDLHHMRSAEARRCLIEFLHQARLQQATCVRIIHGKGLVRGMICDKPPQTGAPVLKNLVNGYLRRRKDVIAFASAPPRDGGTGAVLVLLRHYHASR